LEKWKFIENSKVFQISSLGHIRSVDHYVNNNGTKTIRRGRFLKPYKTKLGYFEINLYENNKVRHEYIHRLVATAFCNNDNNYQEIHHIDYNKFNNECTNLLWCSREYNQIDMVEHYNKKGIANKCKTCGKHISKGSSYCRKCFLEIIQNKSEYSYKELKKLLYKYNGNFTQVSKLYNVSSTTIRRICKKQGIPSKSKFYKRVQ